MLDKKIISEYGGKGAILNYIKKNSPFKYTSLYYQKKKRIQSLQ